MSEWEDYAHDEHFDKILKRRRTMRVAVYCVLGLILVLVLIALNGCKMDCQMMYHRESATCFPPYQLSPEARAACLQASFDRYAKCMTLPKEKR